jgi:CBS-domain-containing membrane protein
MTVQYDEKVPSIFKKLIENNISAVPVLDLHRRYLGMIDNMALVIHVRHKANTQGRDEAMMDR